MRYQNLPYALISENNGETWRYGGLAPSGEGTRSVSETQSVELSDGSILLNGRGGGRPLPRAKTVEQPGPPCNWNPT